MITLRQGGVSRRFNYVFIRVPPHFGERTWVLTEFRKHGEMKSGRENQD